jgi:hypothetical protein
MNLIPISDPGQEPGGQYRPENTDRSGWNSRIRSSRSVLEDGLWQEPGCIRRRRDRLQPVSTNATLPVSGFHVRLADSDYASI